MPRIVVFFFNDTATTEIYTLSLHDALPICRGRVLLRGRPRAAVVQRLVVTVHAQAGHHAPLGRELDGVLQVEGRVALPLEGVGVGRGHGARAAVDGVVDRSAERTPELQSHS